MSDLTPFIDNIHQGLNNPECSFWVGATIGQYLILKVAIGFVIAYVVCKLLDKWLLEPISEIIKNKIWNKKREEVKGR